MEAVDKKTTQGTLVLDGLIEGPVPPIKDGAEQLREWDRFAQKSGLKFHLSIDGSSFSLLADSTPLKLQENETLQDCLKQTMEQLLIIFPDDLRCRVFSTVRSIEYLEEEKIQSLYLISQDGVQVKSRKMPLEKGEHPEEAEDFFTTPIKNFVPLIVGASILAVMAIASAFIFDYSELLNKVGNKYGVVSEDRFEIDAEAVSHYLVLEKNGFNKGKSHLVVEVKRTEAFPVNMEAYRAEKERILEEDKVRELQAINKLFLDGTIRVKYFNKKDELLTEKELNIRELLDEEKIDLLVPIEEFPAARRLKFLY